MRCSEGGKAFIPETDIMVFFGEELRKVLHEGLLIGGRYNHGAVREGPVEAMGVAVGGLVIRTSRLTRQGGIVGIRVLQIVGDIRWGTAPEWGRVIGGWDRGTCIGDKCRRAVIGGWDRGTCIGDKCRRAVVGGMGCFGDKRCGGVDRRGGVETMGGPGGFGLGSGRWSWSWFGLRGRRWCRGGSGATKGHVVEVRRMSRRDIVEGGGSKNLDLEIRVFQSVGPEGVEGRDRRETARVGLAVG
jgi:hypothetical protein